MNACMSDLWVRQGLSHGMLLRSLGSFLRCDDTLVDSGSGEWNEGKLNLSSEPQITPFIATSLNSVIVTKAGVLYAYDHTVHWKLVYYVIITCNQWYFEIEWASFDHCGAL